MSARTCPAHHTVPAAARRPVRVLGAETGVLVERDAALSDADGYRGHNTAPGDLHFKVRDGHVARKWCVRPYHANIVLMLSRSDVAGRREVARDLREWRMQLGAQPHPPWRQEQWRSISVSALRRAASVATGGDQVDGHCSVLRSAQLSRAGSSRGTEHMARVAAGRPRRPSGPCVIRAALIGVHEAGRSSSSRGGRRNRGIHAVATTCIPILAAVFIGSFSLCPSLACSFLVPVILILIIIVVAFIIVVAVVTIVIIIIVVVRVGSNTAASDATFIGIL